MRRFVTLGVILVCAVWSTTALGQAHEDNEGYEALPDGVDLNGQGDFYLPPAGGISAKVVTYADNYLGLPENPTGGKNFVAAEGAGGTDHARSQKDMTYGDGVWTITADVAVTFHGTGASAQNIGSFSMQVFPGERTCIYPLGQWFNIADPQEGWNVWAGWYKPEGGGYVLEQIVAPGFQQIKTDHWYRSSIKFDLDSNQILELTMTDLTTGETSKNEPVDRYLEGGQGGGGIPDPTGLRYFGGTSIAGNTMCFDNLDIEPEVAATTCWYKIKKSKPKKGCLKCPEVGTEIDSAIACPPPCAKKHKIRKDTCLEGPGHCKTKGKKPECK